MSDKETQCQGCGRMFKCIARHKCKSTLEPEGTHSRSQAWSAQSISPAMSDKETQCQGCGRMFKCIGRHKCKNTIELEEEQRQGSSAASRGTAIGLNSTPHSQVAGETCSVTFSASDTGRQFERTKSGNFLGGEYYKQVAKQVKMNRKDRNHVPLNEYKEWACEALNKALQDTVPRKHKQWNVLPSGSYYERTKIKTANEFDIMLCTDYDNFQCLAEFDSSCPPLTCRIRCRDDLGSQARKQLMCEHPKYSNYISPSKFKYWVGETLKNCFQNDHKIDRLRNIKVKVRNFSPGVALTVEYHRRSPSSEGFEADMVPAIHMPDWPPASIVSDKRLECLPGDAIKARGNGYDIVPATHDEDMLKVKHRHDTLWRLSFSRTEKQVLSHADERPNMKLHRKCTYRHLKYHVEEINNKQPDNNIYFTSFHLKHSLFHSFSEFPRGISWVDGLACIVRALEKLIVFLKNRNLPHYFVPDKNLLEYRGENITEQNASWLINELSKVKYQYVNG